MAKQEEAAAAAPAEKAAGGSISIKQLLMFGVPVFVVICGLMIWLLPKFMAPPSAGSSEKPAAAESKGHGEKSSSKEEGGEKGGEAEGEPNIYIVKDVILNPAGTNGTRFLLTTVGFEVTTAEAKKELEGKDVQVRDALNTILTTKTLTTLAMPEKRDSIRMEIAEKVGKLLHSGELTSVYFSKFIIQ